MIPLGKEIRARVTKLEGDVATLGVFVEGVWARVQARTEVRLDPGSWIRGMFVLHADGETVFFRVLHVEDNNPAPPEPAPSFDGRLDLEA
ncbi:hypothetical protein [Acanthopleuribacter pedis]|uniref:Uncharacterized protein n=1 Tax=Acanthopleuribacter pedis TaxID=442870 RepID=A0A8J7QQI4_9BACT|nr:hypothetical protein [Acanthopleuribacter pedis]MBO1322718.1 hypothetical protein [Acanthopleuribacter pedis]